MTTLLPSVYVQTSVLPVATEFAVIVQVCESPLDLASTSALVLPLLTLAEKPTAGDVCVGVVVVPPLEPFEPFVPLLPLAPFVPLVPELLVPEVPLPAPSPLVVPPALLPEDSWLDAGVFCVSEPLKGHHLFCTATNQSSSKNKIISTTITNSRLLCSSCWLFVSLPLLFAGWLLFFDFVFAIAHPFCFLRL